MFSLIILKLLKMFDKTKNKLFFGEIKLPSFLVQSFSSPSDVDGSKAAVSNRLTHREERKRQNRVGTSLGSGSKKLRFD